MSEPAIRARDEARPRRQRAARPALEGLEDRMLLYSVSGNHFTFGTRITWSVMPDGTSLGGIPSNFISTMNQKFGQGNWLNSLSDAFAQWEDVANVNFAQVPDNGAPFGSGNYQQGGPDFGDIRIGGFAQSGGTLAFALLPPKANGGSDAGDILFNTNQPWHINSDYDLETVALHEIGHALGMGHSADVNAIMYPYYGGVQQGPDSDDIAGIQSIWGDRQEDPFVRNTGNLNFYAAANVTGFMTPSNGQVYLPGLNVADSSETYWFKVTTPANASSVFTAQVQSSGLSELSPRVSVYNASGRGLVQASASATSYGATINATITNATANTTYYVKVQGSNAGATGTGAYALTINMGYGYIGNAPPPNTAVAVQPDQGGGYEVMSTGGAGSWLKQWVLSNGKVNFSAMGVQANASFVSDLQRMARQFTAPGASALTEATLDAALLGLLADATGDASTTGPVPITDDGSPQGMKAKIQSILSRLFSSWQSS